MYKYLHAAFTIKNSSQLKPRSPKTFDIQLTRNESGYSLGIREKQRVKQAANRLGHLWAKILIESQASSLLMNNIHTNKRFT